MVHVLVEIRVVRVRVETSAGLGSPKALQMPLGVSGRRELLRACNPAGRVILQNSVDSMPPLGLALGPWARKKLSPRGRERTFIKMVPLGR